MPVIVMSIGIDAPSPGATSWKAPMGCFAYALPEVFPHAVLNELYWMVAGLGGRFAHQRSVPLAEWSCARIIDGPAAFVYVTTRLVPVGVTVPTTELPAAWLRLKPT